MRTPNLLVHGLVNYQRATTSRTSGIWSFFYFALLCKEESVPCLQDLEMIEILMQMSVIKIKGNGFL
jgi:hypothetical protein